MNTRTRPNLLALAGSIAIASGAAFAQNEKPPAKPITPPPSKEKLPPTDKAPAKEPIKPAPAPPTVVQDADFKKLAALAGEWLATTRLWMQPESDPFMSRTQVRNTLILDGHYLQSEATGQMEGRKVHTLAIFAYNAAAKRFEQSWLDSRTTGINQLRGTFDSSTNAITFTGEIEDPATGKVVSDTAVFKFVDDSTYIVEVPAKTRDGTEYIRMETTYRRKNDKDSTEKPVVPVTRPTENTTDKPPTKK